MQATDHTKTPRWLEDYMRHGGTGGVSGVVRPPEGLDHLGEPYATLTASYGADSPVGEAGDEVVFYPDRASPRLSVRVEGDEIVMVLP